jgi:ribosomal protein S27AE
MLDPLDGAAQPHCPDCGTVLRDDPRGVECGPCGILFLRDGGQVTR